MWLNIEDPKRVLYRAFVERAVIGVHLPALQFLSQPSDVFRAREYAIEPSGCDWDALRACSSFVAHDGLDATYGDAELRYFHQCFASVPPRSDDDGEAQCADFDLEMFVDDAVFCDFAHDADALEDSVKLRH